MKEEVFNYLVNSGVGGTGILILSQVLKRWVPINFGKVKAGAVWAALLSLGAAVLGFTGAWDVSAIVPVLRDGAGYWLAAFGAYKVFTEKAKEAQAGNLEVLELLKEIIIEEE